MQLARHGVGPGGGQKTGRSSLPGDKAFQLHDTYGFPIDLTLEIANEQGLTVDADGFRALTTEQRTRAKADAKARKTGHTDLSAYRTVLDAHGPTDWLAYETLDTESRVVAIWSGGATVDTAGAGDMVTVALDRTPFYAESGGQDSDAGLLTGPNLRAEIIDVQRPVKGHLPLAQARAEGALALFGETYDDTVRVVEIGAEWSREQALTDAFTDDAERAHAFLLLTELALAITSDHTGRELPVIVREISLRIAALAAAD
ncbi:alanine--tRNA ligase-related protein [Micromonospora rifamycinica]|uniref:alanine--tRNA ligase-related protein n=1 Tax=Micromonospora rifamycinica TaxID=291594 RepID=UPI00076D24F3|nr:alanine--tRNA ligase-related protein [Micromonospora rifamycinica]KWV31661.1 hypothetical protein AWV63_16470 [Micromonospora rifamycinica]